MNITTTTTTIQQQSNKPTLQTVVPALVRDIIHLQKGDKIDWIISTNKKNEIEIKIIKKEQK